MFENVQTMSELKMSCVHRICMTVYDVEFRFVYFLRFVCGMCLDLFSNH